MNASVTSHLNDGAHLCSQPVNQMETTSMESSDEISHNLVPIMTRSSVFSSNSISSLGSQNAHRQSPTASQPSAV